tara:strand:- start:3822 stop:4595 length:774 start_codon:yes stop_codon:yes gene_type:complete
MVDKVEINQTEHNPSVEEQAQAQEKTQEAQTPETKSETSETRPEWLPEKFANAEELAKAYGALEQKMSTPKEEATPNEPKTDQLKINQQQAEKSLGFSLDNYYNEFADKGELSEKSYTDLAKQGLDKQVVDGYIAGQQALADNHINSVQSVVGGKENYTNIVKWASDNLNENEVKAFNDTMDSGTLDQAQLAISGIQAKYNQANNEPNLLAGEKANASTGAYRSVGEMLRDINDPKYATDSAFRADVEAKVKASDVI